MSSYLAFISLCIVPPVAAMAIIYGRFIKKLTGKVQVPILFLSVLLEIKKEKNQIRHVSIIFKAYF